MAVIVEEDELLLWRWAKQRHDIPVRVIAEKNLIVVERRSKREGSEFVVPTRSSGNSRFVMKVYCMFCLDPPASFEPVPVGVLVKSGFGRDDGSGATKLISVLWVVNTWGFQLWSNLSSLGYCIPESFSLFTKPELSWVVYTWGFQLFTKPVNSWVVYTWV